MKDDNDRLMAGDLPQDPFAGESMSDDAPRILTVRDLLQSSLSRATARERRDFGTSGHHRIDEATGGLRPGDVWLLGADTSWGKSSFAVMLADENIRRGKRVLIVSAEDSEATYGDRLMRRRSGVAAHRMRHQRLTPDDHDAMVAVLSKGEALPVFIDARGKTVEWLAPRCKRAIVEHTVDIVVFDYVGAFVGKLRQQDRRNMVHYIARALTDIAKTAVPSGIAGVILSQLTLGPDEAEPGKHSIRDSRDLTHMSETTLIGYFAPKDEPEHGVRRGDRCIKVAKSKEGIAGGKVRMSWNSTTAAFDADFGDVAAEDWCEWDNE